MRHLLATGLLWFLSPIVVLTDVWASDTRGRPAPPNIIVFLVDDMGWRDTSVDFTRHRSPVNDHFRTPSMERLAEAGMKFTNAYASSVCSPSRVSFMTGMNAARHRVTDWTLRRDGSQMRRHPSLDQPDWNYRGLAPNRMRPTRFLPERWRNCWRGRAIERFTSANRISARWIRRAPIRFGWVFTSTLPVTRPVRPEVTTARTDSPVHCGRAGVSRPMSGMCPICGNITTGILT